MLIIYNSDITGIAVTQVCTLNVLESNGKVLVTIKCCIIYRLDDNLLAYILLIE